MHILVVVSYRSHETRCHTKPFLSHAIHLFFLSKKKYVEINFKKHFPFLCSVLEMEVMFDAPSLNVSKRLLTYYYIVQRIRSF